MKILIGETNISTILSKYEGEYCRLELEIKNKKYKFACGGRVRVIPDETPYNPLTDMDCGTDAMIGRIK